MVYHWSSGTDILGLFWCTKCNSCHLYDRVAHCCAFGLYFPPVVLTIIVVVERALHNTSLLHSKLIHFTMPWVSLSVSLNIIIILMICFHLWQIQALM